MAIPVVNPLAFAAGTRTTPDDGLNLAHTFPGTASGSPTEQLAAAVFDQFVANADYLIDLHSGGVEYLFQPLVGFYGEPEPDNASFQAAHSSDSRICGSFLPLEGSCPTKPGSKASSPSVPSTSARASSIQAAAIAMSKASSHAWLFGASFRVARVASLRARYSKATGCWPRTRASSRPHAG